MCIHAHFSPSNNLIKLKKNSLASLILQKTILTLTTMHGFPRGYPKFSAEVIGNDLDLGLVEIWFKKVLQDCTSRVILRNLC